MRYTAKVIEYFGCESPVVWDHWNSQIDKSYNTLAEAEKDAEKKNAKDLDLRKRSKKPVSRVDQYLRYSGYPV